MYTSQAGSSTIVLARCNKCEVWAVIDDTGQCAECTGVTKVTEQILSPDSDAPHT